MRKTQAFWTTLAIALTLSASPAAAGDGPSDLDRFFRQFSRHAVKPDQNGIRIAITVIPCYCEDMDVNAVGTVLVLPRNEVGGTQSYYARCGVPRFDATGDEVGHPLTLSCDAFVVLPSAR